MADSRELNAQEWGVELLNLIGNSKSIFRFQMLDWYDPITEKKVTDGLSKKEVTAAHIVSVPLTEYVRYEIENFRLSGANGAMYFMERGRFLSMPQPSGIEICDLFVGDSSVLLTRYEINRKQQLCRLIGGSIIEDKIIVEKYKSLQSEITKNAKTIEDFANTMMHVKPAIVEHLCTACGCEEATLIFYGIIYGDEAPLEIYKCKNCGKVVREGYTT